MGCLGPPPIVSLCSEFRTGTKLVGVFVVQGVYTVMMDSLLDKSGTELLTLLQVTTLYKVKNVHSTLSKAHQESINLSSLEVLKSELISPCLLSSKNKSVKTLVACCLADFLRLYFLISASTEKNEGTKNRIYFRR